MEGVQSFLGYGLGGAIIAALVFLATKMIDRGFTIHVPPKRR